MVWKEKLFYRMLDVIEGYRALTPASGYRLQGLRAAVSGRTTFLVWGDESRSLFALWHGEVYTIKLFYELQGTRTPSECIFLSTMNPAHVHLRFAWAGFENYYFFGYEQSRRFNIPHDLRMLREVFGCVSHEENIY